MHFDNKIIMMVMYFENYHCDVSSEGVVLCDLHLSSSPCRIYSVSLTSVQLVP